MRVVLYNKVVTKENKLMRKIFAVILAVVCALSFVACSGKIDAIKTAFEREGYVEVEEATEKEIYESLAGDKYELEVRVFAEGYRKAVVLSFASESELKKALFEEESFSGIVDSEGQTVDEMYESAEEKGYVNGNCAVVPISVSPTVVADILTIFKNA